MIHTMMITFVQIAAGLAKVCGMVQTAANAVELVDIQNSTGMTIMSNWPFPKHPPTPWTEEQIKEYAQQQRAQVKETLL